MAYLPGKRIVLVEDNGPLLSSLTFALEIDGYDVDAFESAEAALAFDMGTAACLIVDYGLPGVNGLDLIQRARLGGVTIPAILITTNPRPAIRGRAALMGVIVVEKPLLSDALLDTVQRIAERGPALAAQ